jgi:hypothetical protein
VKYMLSCSLLGIPPPPPSLPSLPPRPPLPVGRRRVRRELGVSMVSMQVPVATYKKGPVPAAFVGHSKGTQKILLERGVIAETSKLKRKAAKQAVGIGKERAPTCRCTWAGLIKSRAASIFCSRS